MAGFAPTGHVERPESESASGNLQFKHKGDRRVGRNQTASGAQRIYQDLVEEAGFSDSDESVASLSSCFFFQRVAGFKPLNFDH
jgi:hypothetical protein